MFRSPTTHVTSIAPTISIILLQRNIWIQNKIIRTHVTYIPIGNCFSTRRHSTQPHLRPAFLHQISYKLLCSTRKSSIEPRQSLPTTSSRTFNRSPYSRGSHLRPTLLNKDGLHRRRRPTRTTVARPFSLIPELNPMPPTLKIIAQ